nr:hypothetical protein [Desulfobulbaceae bacterium]
MLVDQIINQGALPIMGRLMSVVLIQLQNGSGEAYENRIGKLNSRFLRHFLHTFFLEDSIMQNEHFDLNDIRHEPTDSQLESLMDSVAQEAKRRADLAAEALMQRLRDDIVAANRSRPLS